MSEEGIKTSFSSPQKIHALGHRLTRAFLEGTPVLVTEKVDGSYLQAGVFPVPGSEDPQGVPREWKLRIRSKGQEIDLSEGAGAGMFHEGVETIKRLAPRFLLGHTYRGEYLKKPGHNALVYERVPIGHWILFDVLDGNESYLPYNQVQDEAERLGLEVVPFVHQGDLTPDMLKGFLDRTSILGGQKVEGVVIKPLYYDIYDTDGKVVFAKYVSKEFKEVHAKAWNRENPGPSDIRDVLVKRLTTPARWQKAVIHAEEEGTLVKGVQDIGPLLQRIQTDVLEEETERIKDALFGWAKQHITRGVTRGFPEWYKAKLQADLEPPAAPELFIDNTDDEVIHVGEVS